MSDTAVGLHRDALVYFVGRVVSAIGSVAGLVVVSRAAGDEALGEVSVQLAMGALGSAILVQPARITIARFWPEPGHGGLSRLLRLSAGMAVGCTAIGAVAAAFGGFVTSFWVAAAYVLLVGAHEVVLEVERAELRPARFAAGLVARNVGTLFLVVILVQISADGILIATAWPGSALVGLLVANASSARRLLWFAMHKDEAETVLRRQAAYGALAGLTALLSILVITFDRVILAATTTSALAGVYALAYDIGHEAVYVSSAVVNQAGQPRLIGAHSGNDRLEERRIYDGILRLIVVTGLGISGLALLGADWMAAIVLGGRNADVAAQVTATASLLGAILAVKVFYLDMPLHLSVATRPMVLILFTAAVVGVGSTAALAGTFEHEGALSGSVIAYGIATLATARIVRRRSDIALASAVATTVVLMTACVVCIAAPAAWRPPVGAFLAAGAIVFWAHRSSRR